MQTIETKYFGPAGRGARVKATTSSGETVTVPYDPGLSDEDNHHLAAMTLARKLKWTGRMVAGGARRGNGNIYVFLPKSARETLRIESWKPRHGDKHSPRRRSRSSRRSRR